MKIVVLIFALCSMSSAHLLTQNCPDLESFPYENTHSAGQKVREAFKRQLVGDASESADVNLLGYSGKSGMIPINEKGSSMFYWQINSKGHDIEHDQVPLILWLQGGPGCSSQIGNWAEFGPFYADDQGQPQLRNTTWASNYHLLFIDNPIGSGYSFATNAADLITTETEMATYLYDMLQSLSKLYPTWFSNRQLYIAGESYAGKYVPVIAYKILTENSRAWITGMTKLPLAGVAIGDGWTWPYYQMQYYADYGYSVGVLDDKETDVVQGFVDQGMKKIEEGDYLEARNAFFNIISTSTEAGFGFNEYNYRIYGSYYNNTGYKTYLNLPATKDLLHVPQEIYFKNCNKDVYNALGTDFMQSARLYMPYVLEKIRVLLYNGQDDFAVNTPGALSWIDELHWAGADAFRNANKTFWMENGSHAGYVQVGDNLTQLTMIKSGHMVPIDQPENALKMITNFIEQESWE